VALAESKIYGIVIRIPASEGEHFWKTKAYDFPDDTEGSYLYEFDDHSGWELPIRTARDLKFFQTHKGYEVKLAGGRPKSRRPKPQTEPEVVKEAEPEDSPSQPGRQTPGANPFNKPSKITDRPFEERLKNRPFGERLKRGPGRPPAPEKQGD
jgi:hypothetical protein